MPSPEEMKRYEEMLDQLMEEYPELESEAASLKTSMMEMPAAEDEDMAMEEEMPMDEEMDMEEMDMADEEVPADMDEEAMLDLELDLADEEEEEEPTSKKKKRMPIL